MRKFGLIGYPLTHSFSSKFFAEKFLQEEIADCSYQNFSLENITLFPALLKDHPDIEGVNVTIPYKQSVQQYLNELDPTAAEVGAVNCIDTLTLKGYNTDVIGFRLSLKPLLKNFHTHALILGTGGAAKAIAYVLSDLGITYSYVSRKQQQGYLTYEELTDEVIRQHTVIINTTPLGTFPDIQQAPDIPYQFLSSNHLLYDLVYNPAETLFLQKGKAHGAAVKNGYEMLVLQAEASWNIWNGR